MSEIPDAPVVDQPDSPEEPEQPDISGGATAEPEPFDEDRARAKIKKANSEAANLRRQLKELEPLVAKAKELEDANKSESERLTERVTLAEQRAQEAELRALRLEVAHDKGLTAAQARRLVGSTKEELEEDADDLLASFTKSDPPKKVPRGPQPKLRGGSDPDEPVEESDPKKLAASIPRR